jgi:hypothetical protein
MHKTTLMLVVTELTVPIINPFYLNNLPEGKLTVNFPTLCPVVRASLPGMFNMGHFPFLSLFSRWEKDFTGQGHAETNVH